MQSKETYSFRNAIIKLVFIGVAVFLGCTVVGVLISQLIGWGLTSLWGKDGWFFENDYFSNFFGGAIGLVVGFILDTICIDKINNVSKCKNFIMSVKHELDGIYSIMTNTKQDEVILQKQGKEVIIVFDANGDVLTDISGCSGYKKIEELIFDDLVTSVEAMSLISSLPFAKREFINEIVDFLGKIHKLISEFNETFVELELKMGQLNVEIEQRNKTNAQRKQRNEDASRANDEILKSKITDLSKKCLILGKKCLETKCMLNFLIKSLTINENEIIIERNNKE